MNAKLGIICSAVLSCLVVAVPASAEDQPVRVTIESLAPEGGVYFSPVWIGLHDGSFDLFDPGALSGEALERLAEDGDTSLLRAEFAATGGLDTVVTAPAGFEGLPVFDPGESSTVELVAAPGINRYLSFLSMVVPSNDAFIGNHNPRAVELYDAAGNFKGKQIITVLGSQVWDAGTELNTEMDAAFINQTAANTGVTTACPVLPHPGYIGSYANPGGASIILGGTNSGGAHFDPAAADFTLPHAVVARITIEPLPTDENVQAAVSVRISALGRGNGALGTVYVTSQHLYYDTFVTADPLPFEGPFQKLVNGTTEFGPGQPGYLGGRWWIDDGDNVMEPRESSDDRYFLCPLLPPGRTTP